MYEFGAQQEIEGEVEQLWAVWTDLPRFPEWDPREQETRPAGPFAEGTTVWSKQKGNPGGESTITRVEAPRRWTAESPLPAGKLVIDHELQPAAAGRVLARKHYEVHGPLSIVFRLWYGPRVRRALAASFTALEHEAARRG
ncbi:MAG: SRPBCC family protein [Solirubrobacterales bacterium]|nr:SRPBCC family protein [Solirubrobacterales bacterium]